MMAASGLQSQDHRDLLDIIDKLRRQGLSKYVDLPQIVVCGDQSAGKSSVLEAISRMTFPTKDNLCTRFATELILRRDVQVSVKVSIDPAVDRSSTDREILSSFRFDVDSNAIDLGAAVDAAKEAMGLSDVKAFSKDILRVELTGPNQPHLTLVDLPGIFRAGSKDQSLEDADTVRDMVRGYMSRTRSIILAVVSAKHDFNLQDVTEFAREVDPEGSRTLGLITKPDTLDAGSDSERFFLDLAHNRDVVLRLGWHVLMNRSYTTKDASSEERDQMEASFFGSGSWALLDSRLKGVRMLMTRLSQVLKEQILRQLPSLLRDVEDGIQACQLEKKRLGVPRNSIEDHRRYLLQVSQDFSTLIKSATDGVYTDAFFGDAKTDIGYEKRLRAVVQNSLTDFAEQMRIRGEYRVIDDSTHHHQPRISRSDYVDEVKTLMRRSRGRELPGTFNPLLISELFTEQSQPWENIVITAKQTIIDATYITVKHILRHVATDDASAGIFRLISVRIGRCTDELNRKVVELLKPHKTGHPITYNHYLTDNVQKAQSARRAQEFEAAFKQAVGISDIKDGTKYKTLPLQLLNRLQQRTQVDMERYASELAVDYMQAYYKVALKKFVDDFSILAVEQCLLQDLASTFDPQMVYSIKDSELLTLTSESEETVHERARCLEKLTALEAALLELRRLDRFRRLEVGPGQEATDGQKLMNQHTPDDEARFLAQLDLPVVSVDHEEEPVMFEDRGTSEDENATIAPGVTPTPIEDTWDNWAAPTKWGQKSKNKKGTANLWPE